MAGSYCGLFPEKKLKVQYELPKSAEKAAFSLIEDAVMDAEKLRALGWYAEVPVREGLLRSVQYYMELGERTDMDW